MEPRPHLGGHKHYTDAHEVGADPVARVIDPLVSILADDWVLVLAIAFAAPGHRLAGFAMRVSMSPICLLISRTEKSCSIMDLTFAMGMPNSLTKPTTAPMKASLSGEGWPTELKY